MSKKLKDKELERIKELERGMRDELGFGDYPAQDDLMEYIKLVRKMRRSK